MSSITGSTLVQSSPLVNEASADTPPALKNSPTVVVARGSNPAFTGLTVRPARPLPPQVVNTHAGRSTNDLGTAGVAAKAVLGKIAGARALFEKLPTELLLKMDLDPKQMQSVSRRFVRMYREEGVAMSLTDKRPPARSLDGVTRSLSRLETSVGPRLRHDPLAVLCSRLGNVPPRERMATFSLLAEATEKCDSPFRPLTELFRQTRSWSAPDRDLCRARLMSVEGAERAETISDARNIFDCGDVPAFIEGIVTLPAADRSAELGALADQLFSLPNAHLISHEFARICEDYHHLPWPPAAAAGFLGRAWITSQARERLEALSQGRA